MKKIIALLMVLVIVFGLSACSGSNPYKKLTDDELSQKVENGSLNKLTCYYSVENEDKTDDEILVHFPEDVYDSEEDDFYDEDDETHIIFYGDKAFYNKETGEAVTEDTLEYGQLMEVIYDGEVYSKNPITIKAVKVLVYDK